MIASIIKFELRNRYSQWITTLLYGLLIFQGIWYTKGAFDYYVNEGMLMNSPAIFYKNLAGGGILMIIIVAVITGPVLYKEKSYKTGQWMFTNPLNEKLFFVGKFLSAFLINVLIAFGYVIGMLLVPYAGIGEAHQFRDAPIGQLLQGFFVILVPNLLLLTSLIFSAIVLSKKTTAGYLAVLVTVVSFLVMQTTAETSGHTPLLLLVDPFGYVTTDYTISLLSTDEKNHGYISMEGYLLANRLIWIFLSITLAAIAYLKFNFKYFLKDSEGKKQINSSTDKIGSKDTLRISKPVLSFSQLDFIKKAFSLTALEFKNVVRPTSFRIILGIILLMATLQNLLWNASVYIGPTQPLTFVMTNFRLAFGVFIMILLMVWAGELFFKDRTVKIWQISDALPVPLWVVAFSRFLAMAGVAFVLAFSFLIIGVVFQVLNGGFRLIDWNLYLYDLLGYNWGWLTYVLQIALVFFIAGFTGSRFLTHIASVGILFITIMAFELGLAEQTIFAYGAVPGLEDYSEMSGYGIWQQAAIWYFLMWVLLAGAFILLGILFWHRGTSRNFLSKFSFSNHQLAWSGKIVILVFIAAFFTLRFFIIDQVNSTGNFTLSSVEEAEDAHYEKKYSYIKKITQPKYQHVDLTFDFFPEERKAEYKAKITLKNTSGKSIDSLYLNFEDFIQLNTLAFNNHNLNKAWEDKNQKIAAYSLTPPLGESEVGTLVIKATKQYIGFTQSGASPQPDLMFNGSFGNIREFLPIVGYDNKRTLKENRQRIANGLPKISSRMAAINDSRAIREDSFAPDALWVSGTIQISTSEGQVAFAPGYLNREWQENNRNYYLYEVKNPSPFNWYLGSAEYNKAESEVNGVDFTILHDKKHHFNLAIYEEAAKKSLLYIEKNWGKFPHSDIRIAEIPYYQEAFYSFPNTIAISEKEGWYADVSGLEEKAYIYQTVATQLVKQWLYSNLSIANVQGADMLKVALPEALGLQVVHNILGDDAVILLVKKKNDSYAKERHNEPNQEPPLLYADGIDYLEINKGAIALFKVSEEMGFTAFNKKIKHWIEEANTGPVIFSELYSLLQPKNQEVFVSLD
ncbi:MAG: hypothetical protein AAGI07_01190 [Bacteroidota bacterium]